jgi:structure-specific endonuclease subunit SLX1|uniref:GIY-YIG domain-containing protein n=1 Tax=viral metagenome TaxID=1070528 RepID=A0A6C0EDW9_9ZZZZ
MSYCVYLLINTNNNRTYIGITNNINRRIRQHNGELVGGAKYTTNNKNDGKWMYYGFIINLSKNISLSLEKKIKIKSRKLTGTPLEKRLKAINFIIDEYNLNNLNDIIIFNPI